MNLSIIITTYNRPAETKRCFDSIRLAIIPEQISVNFIVVDDCSTETMPVLGMNETILRNKNNMGIRYSLKRGYDLAFANGADIAMNLDNDALVSTYFIHELVRLKSIWQNNIVTGFNCNTRNADGSERHKVLRRGEGYNIKASVGGINMVLHKQQYTDYVRPALDEVGNWDHKACINAGMVVCLEPSVIQHQATKSSMGHNEQPDVADDFIPLILRDVTLICVDDNKQRGERAIRAAEKNIGFAKTVLVHDQNLNSKEAYSKFILDNLYEYAQTSHVLIVQHDGYPVNWQSWNWEWLQYDYIGAPWPEEYGQHRNGNGGFSLRSQKLCRTTAGINWHNKHPEDAVICRELRPKLESDYDIKFAPLEVAEKFSYEGYNQPSARFNDQFGFHNRLLAEELSTGRFNGEFPFRPKYTKQGFIINQFLGLGDILFLVPLARYWMQQGHDIIWPIADEYFSIKESFPDIQFVRKSDWPRVRYDEPREYNHAWQYGMYQVKPLRWNRSRTLEEAMTTKYTMYGLDWKMWRGLHWQRNMERERKLAELVQAEGKYTLVWQEYGSVTSGGASVKALDITGRCVYVSKMQGYTILDWALIIENAAHIHAVSSSNIYLFETLNLKAKEVHLYSRKAGQKDFDMVRPLLTKKYVFHL